MHEVEFVDFTGADLTNVSFKDAKLHACVGTWCRRMFVSGSGTETYSILKTLTTSVRFSL